jgi:Ca2+-binding RTX toxin-like protein
MQSKLSGIYDQSLFFNTGSQNQAIQQKIDTSQRIIDGFASRDLIIAVNGNNLVFSGPGDDVVWIALGKGTVYAGEGIDRVYGGSDRDDLYGDENNDTLIGGAGPDNLYGGRDADIFRFLATDLAHPSQVPLPDTIHDYRRTEGDRIDVSDIVGPALFAGEPVGSLVRARSQTASGQVVLEVDANGRANGSEWTPLAYFALDPGAAIDVVLGPNISDQRMITVATGGGTPGDPLVTPPGIVTASIRLEGVVYRVQLGVEPEAFHPTQNGVVVTDAGVLADLYAATKSLSYASRVIGTRSDAQFVSEYVEPVRDVLAALERIAVLGELRDFLAQAAGAAVTIRLRPDALVPDADDLANAFGLIVKQQLLSGLFSVGQLTVQQVGYLKAAAQIAAGEGLLLEGLALSRKVTGQLANGQVIEIEDAFDAGNGLHDGGSLVQHVNAVLSADPSLDATVIDDLKAMGLAFVDGAIGAFANIKSVSAVVKWLELGASAARETLSVGDAAAQVARDVADLMGVAATGLPWLTAGQIAAFEAVFSGRTPPPVDPVTDFIDVTVGPSTLSKTDARILVSDMPFLEGYAGEQFFLVRLSDALPNDVTVRYTLYSYGDTPGYAAPGTDFVARAGQTLTIPAGQTFGLIPVTIADDTIAESAVEQFKLSIYDPRGATLGNGLYNDVLSGWIVDDDRAVDPVLRLSLNEVIAGNTAIAGSGGGGGSSGGGGSTVALSPPVFTTGGSNLAAVAFAADVGGASSQGTVTVTYTVKNVGDARSARGEADIVLADNAALSVGRRVGDDYSIPELNPGESRTWTREVTLPVSGNGEYFLGIDVRSVSLGHNRIETDDTASIQFRIGPGLSGDPDLRISFASVPPGVVATNGVIEYGVIVRTNSNGSPAYDYQTLLSDDRSLSYDDSVILDRPSTNTGGLGFSGQRTHNHTNAVPYGTTDGIYYIIAVVDPYDRIAETAEDNNVRVSDPIVVSSRVADADALPNIVGSHVVLSDSVLDVTQTYRFSAFAYLDSPEDPLFDPAVISALAVPFRYVFSADAVLDPQDQPWRVPTATANDPLGDVIQHNSNTSLPRWLPSGDIYLFALFDHNNEIAEDREWDNATTPVKITVVNNEPRTVAARDDAVAVTEGAVGTLNLLDNDDSSIAQLLSVRRLEGEFIGTEAFSLVAPSGLVLQVDSAGQLRVDASNLVRSLESGETLTERFTYVLSGASDGSEDLGTISVTIRDPAAITTRRGGPLSDLLLGDDGIDLIEGGAGPDNLNGGAGYDTYRFARRWGQDTIIDPDRTGKLIFDGVAQSELTFANVGGSLVISDGANHITFADYVNGAYAYDIEYLGAAQGQPAAVDDAFVTEENSSLAVASPGVLVNDLDDNGDPLIANLIAGPANGVLVLGADGGFTYTPDANFSGSDSFTYSASDGTTDSPVATVSITITPAPPVVTVINGTNGNDTIRTAAAGGSLGGLPNSTDSGNTIFASLGNDTVIAGAGADSIDGGDGNDFIDGGAGNDTIIGGPGADFVRGGVGNDTLQTGTNIDGTELAFGDSDNDELTGGSSGNGLAFLFGGAGNDVIRGNNFTGNLADYSDRSLAVVANLGAGTATIGGTEADTLVNVRGIRTGAGNDQITGSSGNDVILPGLGNNVVDGGLGVDRLMYAYLSNGVTVDLLNGFATKLGDGSTDTLSNIENVRGTNYNDSLLGNNADNDLSGLSGDDIIDGRGGYDNANYFAFNSAGPGNSYFADPGSFPFTQGVTVNLTSGSATDSWGGTDTLIGIEAVNGTFFNDDLTGIAFADGTRSLLTGNAGNDTLRGTGIDRSITANYTSDQARVLVNLSTGNETLAGTFVAAGTAKDGYGGTDTIISIQSVRGSAFNDIIVGTNLADRLEGEGGNDTIYGRAGNDQVRGNAGNDTLFGEDGDDAVQGGAGVDTASGGAGYDNLRFDTAGATQGAVASLTTGQITDEFGNAETIGAVNDFEMLVGSNLADDLEGKALPGDITQLEARAGNDTLRAGSGNSAGVVAYYAFDPDQDNDGIGIVADLTLATQQVTDGYGTKDTLIGVGGVRGTRFDDLITGNDDDNWFRGEGGDDVIDGRGGFDILSYTSFASNGVQVSGITATLADGAGTVIDGLGGTDTVSSIEQINGSARADTITITGSQGMKVLGNDGDDVITGGDGDDDLSGGNGADSVDGGGGNDTLRGVSGHTNNIGALDVFTGGAGSDTLIIDSTALSGFAVADIVTDFEGGIGGDVVDITNVVSYLVNTSEISTGQNPFATGHLRVISGSAVVQVDWDGSDGPQAFTDLVILQGPTPLQLVAANFGGFDPMVNTPPTALPDNYALARGRVSVIDAAAGIGANDIDTGPLSFSLLNGPAEGSVLLNADGSFTYTADPNFVGVTSFTYRATDTDLASSDANVVLTIEERAETLTGTSSAETLFGYGLDDVLTGLAGNDILDGGDGTDTADYSAAPAGITTDLAVSAIVEDGYGFTDTLQSIEAIRGSDVAGDLMLGNDAANSFFGQGGDDRQAGRGGNDLLDGGAGNDLLFAGAGNDTVNGGDGDDRFLGDNGDDILNGDAGNDVIWAGGGNDTIDGGAGNDTLVGESGDDVILGGAGGDNIRGQGGNDTVDAGADNDRVQGGDGDDVVNGGGGNDNLAGDVGNDTLSGDAGNDAVSGGSGNDTLLGGAGGDALKGDAGQDRLDGGAGLDALNGGADADVFVLARLQADRDWISAFVSGEDQLEVSAALFGGGLAPGALDPSRLVMGANPQAAQPGVGTFLFDTGTGRLRWDADGSGLGWPPVIATLTGVNSLSASDFVIV